MKTHLEQIDKFIESLSEEVQLALGNISSHHNYKKGDIILREGQICRCSYHFIEGIGRKFYINDDGKEITTEFYFPTDLDVAFESYIFQKPSKEYIECLTDIKVSVTDYHNFNALKNKYPILEKFDLMITEIYTVLLEHRLFDSRTLNATQRYSKLLGSHPHFIQYLSLTHIASYLGVSLETLSRIRAKKLI
jgi:CRP-like cAMP-binding protein